MSFSTPDKVLTRHESERIGQGRKTMIEMR